MKKNAITAAALIAALALAGCSNGNAAKTTTAASSAAPETTTTAAETTTAETTTEETTTTPETTTTEEETEAPSDVIPDDSIIFSAGGVTITGKDVVATEYGMPLFDGSIARVSTGTYYDSNTNPDYFDVDEFIYKGEKLPLDELKLFKTGDTIGGLTVTETSSMFDKSIDADGNLGWYVFSSDFTLDGEMTLTGVARYYFDEQYGICNGDIRFIPDASYAGLPVPVLLDYINYGNGPMNGYGFSDFDEKGDWDNRQYGGGVCVYSDAPIFNVGNLHSSYGDDADMTAIFDGGGTDCTKKIEVTLTDIHISYSNQFGAGRTRATIKDIKAID